jgi:hypothetical protein
MKEQRREKGEMKRSEGGGITGRGRGGREGGREKGEEGSVPPERAVCCLRR